MTQIIVLGSLHMDVIVHAARRPRKGETLSGTAWGLRAGGKGGNQAVQAAQQGATVAMIGRIGDDDFGPDLLKTLQKAGVNTSHVTVDQSAGSGMSVAIIDEEGDYGAVIVSGTNLNIDQNDLDRAAHLFESASYLLLQYEVRMQANVNAARFAHEHGVQVILNAAPAYEAPPGLLEHVDILVVNEIEAEMIAGVGIGGMDDAQQTAAMLLEQVPAVIVTLGERGAMVAKRDADMIHLPAYRVNVIDTHGAGDAFIGALAARLTDGDTLEEATRYANAAGAIMVMTAGPQAEQLSPGQVRAFMEEHSE